MDETVISGKHRIWMTWEPERRGLPDSAQQVKADTP